MPEATTVVRGVAHWGTVLHADAPCGEDLCLDPEFELLSQEIGRDKSLHGTQKTDWVVVYELSDSLLTKTKDLWVFAYGIVAVYQIRSIADCIYCVNSLGELLATQWQTLHPSLKRPKRRVAPLKWMCDKFLSIADSTAFLNLSPNDIRALNSAFAGLQERLDSLLPENDLTFGSILRSRLGGEQESPAVSEPSGSDAKRKPQATAPKTQPQPLQATLENIEKSSIIPSAALPQVIRTINDNARQLGDHLLALNKEDVRAYKLHRTGTWDTLLQPPPSDQNGMTELYCPIPPDMIDMYSAGVNDKRYSEMLPQIERAASKSPFWFDGQYLVVKCLEGISAVLPAIAVKHCLAQTVKRFPELLSLKFKDGRPFASPKTVTWIDTFLPVILGNTPFGQGSQVFSNGGTQADEAKRLQDAIALSLEGGFKAGLNLLGDVPPGKTRGFLRHSLLKARYCSAAGHPQAATHILKSIIEKLKLWDLLEWEPELTAESVSLLLSLTQRPRKPDEELQSLLHIISLETALSASGQNIN